MTELEPLLHRIEQLTPHFGRAQDDLLALTTRGRNGDYKGVLQNARLVLEMLLRSLVTTELKQTPGKAMLDELISKFRQQAHAGVIPTHVLAHMGTVQAWGNLSSHDHAGALDGLGVKVDSQDALTSLNSLVAILTWYKERYVQAPEPVTAPPATAAPSSSKRLALLGGGALVLMAAGLGVLAYRPAPGPDASASGVRAKVDALYAENAEPLPPVGCQEKDPRALALLLDAMPRLSDRVPETERTKEARAALELLRTWGQAWSPEGSFHVAKASLWVDGDAPDQAAMDAASLCEGFAAAENLAGRMATVRANVEQKAGRSESAAQAFKDSEKHLERAMALSPRFWKPHFNLGLLHLHQQRPAEAQKLLEHAAKLAPEVSEIHFLLGVAYSAAADIPDPDRASAAFCRAQALGHPKAAGFCIR